MLSSGRSLLPYVVLVLVFIADLAAAVNLQNEEEVQSYINGLVDEFNDNPRDIKFLSIVYPPLCLDIPKKSNFLLPKVLICSPCEQFGLALECPIHKGIILKPWRWAKEVTSQRKGSSARMVYDLYGNIIIVQKIYVCYRGRLCHKLMPTTPDVWNSILMPKVIQEYFPIVLTEKSGYTKTMYDFIETELLQGVNFLKISEGISSLNIREFCRRKQLYSLARLDVQSTSPDNINLSDFYENSIFSFPSNDLLMNIFLTNFKKHSHVYDEHKNSLSAEIISCDHTFKISRNVGVVRGKDNKFVPQYNQVFIILNEKGEVMGWRLTKSTKFSEVQDLLEGIKTRLDSKGKTLQMVCVDDCCNVRKKYNEIFPDTEVKLDLFHACQRITKTLKKVDPIATAFMREFVQIFRRDDDQGPSRLKDTPARGQLERNLNSLLERWIDVPDSPLGNTQTSLEIDHLREHIKKGCLSDIPAGCGTERNEQLHRLLNRSLMTGATRLSVELVVALLTVLFYYHTSKISASRHACNARVVPVLPANGISDGQSSESCRLPSMLADSAVKEHTYHSGSISDFNEEITVTETIDGLCTEYVAQSIISVALSIQDIIKNVDAQSCNRAFDPNSLLHLSRLSNLLLDTSESNDPCIRTHVDDLKRHLAGFGLKIDSVSKDGDCAFRSIVRQLQKLDLTNNKQLEEHLMSLNLLSGFEDEDTLTLRQLFVEELVQREEKYSGFVSGPAITLAERANEFRMAGVFDRDVGDLTMRVCCDVLKVSIIVITSSRPTPVVPFVPDVPLSTTPMYVAFHYYGAGHYDATISNQITDKVQESEELPPSDTKFCHCGRHAESRMQKFCISDSRDSTRCPCVIQGRQCSKGCKCFNCDNKPPNNIQEPKKCRCGEAGKGSVAKNVCTDVPGQRRTKCPCYTSGSSCSEICNCKGCANSFGKREIGLKKKRTRVAKCTSSPSPLKRKRGMAYMEETNSEVRLGSWTTIETCILEAVESFLCCTCFLPTGENITYVFNHVVKSCFSRELQLHVSEKTTKQVEGKLNFEKNKSATARSLAYGIDAL